MNKSKSSSYVKLIAFFLVAAILVFAFGFAADGWQFNKIPDSGNINQNEQNNKNDEADENKNGNEGDAPTVKEESEEPEIYIPEHVNMLTGLETTEVLSRRRPIAFVMNSASPLYAISSSELIIELPIEDGTTRLLAYTTDTASLGKIGSLAPTRDYISNLAKNFGAIIVSYGNDDTVSYEKCDASSATFDLTASIGYHYTEYTHYVYTNGDLINAGISNANIGTAANNRHNLPYTFLPFGSDIIKGEQSAKSISIPYSQASTTELYYSSQSNLYTLSKNGKEKTDMLNDTPLTFTNCFILFADAVTYEDAHGTETVINTIGSGKGYYFTGGTAISINWSAKADGSMSFVGANGEPLVINRGSSYISFMKSSKSTELIFS